MQNLLKLPFGLLVACLLLATGLSQAAPPPKVDLCHLDADAGIYKLLSVVEQARAPHLAHGDLLPGADNGEGEISLDEECMLVLPPAVLFRAFIDVDDTDGPYDPANDIDIAILTDTNNDGSISIGDEFEFDAYPTSLSPCSAPGVCADLGSATTNTSSLVTQVLFSNSGGFRVQTDAPLQAEAYYRPDLFLERLEIKYPNTTGTEVLNIDDGLGGACSLSDRVSVLAGPPFNPSPVVANAPVKRCGDDQHIDVQIGTGQ